MSRIEDLGVELEEALTEKRIVAIRRSAKIDTSNESGLCWYCDAVLPTIDEQQADGTIKQVCKQRWCDKSCCEGWEKEYA